MAKSLDELTASVETLSVDVQDLARALRSRTLNLRIAIIGLAVVVAVAIFAASNVLLSNDRAIQESNRRWCPVVTALVPRPGDPQPTTERGRVVAAQFVRLTAEFGCD